MLLYNVSKEDIHSTTIKDLGYEKALLIHRLRVIPIHDIRFEQGCGSFHYTHREHLMQQWEIHNTALKSTQSVHSCLQPRTIAQTHSLLQHRSRCS